MKVFSARIPRDSDATAKPAPASVQSTPKANDSSEESSEDSKEDFEKMKASVKELLNEAEKKEFDDVVNGLEKAKTLEESLTGIVRKLLLLTKIRLRLIFNVFYVSKLTGKADHVRC